MASFASRMQADFDSARQQLHRAKEQMRSYADQHRREVEYAVGDYMLLSTKHLRLKNCPSKLQRRFVGPFKIVEKISRAAYKLELPRGWSMHPVFHSSLLKPWRESQWSCPVELPAPEVEDIEEPEYRVERILKWRKMQRGRQRMREFLVTWTGYPLDEAEWIPETNFKDQRQLAKQIRQDRPVEDTGSTSR